ncbi:type II secretion system protein [candidate division KSB1 bacterium]|nr:type II secretion system protein [candidate division KSB1 bacterium]TDI94569.1 MAG: type II secretion system protein [Caldithrix sp.]
MKSLLKLKNILSNSQGFTLIEVIMVIVVFAIAVPTLMTVLSSTLDSSNKSVVISQAATYAQEKIEEIIGDKRNPSKGFDWVTTTGRYSSDVPAVGFSRSIIITSGNVQNGVSYAYVQVKITHSEISDIKLETWLTDY